jgi:hypothetical protein
MEFKRSKETFLFIFCLFTCFVEAFTMIVTRGHYSIDILTGIIVAHYTYMIVESYIDYIDNSCIGMKTKQVENECKKEEDKEGFKVAEIKTDEKVNIV